MLAGGKCNAVFLFRSYIRTLLLTTVKTCLCQEVRYDDMTWKVQTKPKWQLLHYFSDHILSNRSSWSSVKCVVCLVGNQIIRIWDACFWEYLLTHCAGKREKHVLNIRRTCTQTLVWTPPGRLTPVTNISQIIHVYFSHISQSHVVQQWVLHHQGIQGPEVPLLAPRFLGIHSLSDHVWSEEERE